MPRSLRSGSSVGVRRNLGSSSALAKPSPPSQAANRRGDLVLETLLQTALRLQTSINKHFLKLGLTMIDATIVLRCIESPSRATPGKLAAAIGRDKGLVTRVIDRLQKKRFVVRVTARHDKRITFIQPTSKAKKLAPVLGSLFAAIHRQLLNETLDTDLDQLFQLLAKLQQNADGAVPPL
jgi:MarR family transcriptional regulator, repressor for mepA